MKYKNTIVSGQRQGVPGSIRYGILGAALALGGMAAVRPFCHWVVWSAEQMEVILK